ncbi:MAG: hypothetical protein EKK64_08565 [Neisseriaceae bacterium]|nr:MAG: hypothetical protein EKK64_08565 [Neisseriaceae bacterium]
MKPFKSPAELTDEEMFLSEDNLLKIEELKNLGKAKQKVFPQKENVIFEFTYEEFYDKYLNSYREEKKWRDGQYFFNLLLLYRPDLASIIRGVEGIDPFHRDDLIPTCAAWLKEHWQNPLKGK